MVELFLLIIFFFARIFDTILLINNCSHKLNKASPFCTRYTNTSLTSTILPSEAIVFTSMLFLYFFFELLTLIVSELMETGGM